VRLLLETNTTSLTLAELVELVDGAAEALAARAWLAAACRPAAIRGEYLRTAAALFDTVLRPLPPHIEAGAGQPDIEEGEDGAPAAGLDRPVASSGQLSVQSRAAGELAARVCTMCREAVLGEASAAQAAGTDALNPMQSLFLKAAAHLYFAGGLEAVVRAPTGASSPGDDQVNVTDITTAYDAGNACGMAHSVFTHDPLFLCSML
jgi:hypothetical protein